MIDPDYDSMADYVDVRIHQCLPDALDQGKSPEQAFKIIKLSHVIIHVRQCNGMLLKMQVFNRHSMVESLVNLTKTSTLKMKSTDQSLNSIKN